ncbi:MAG: hypothetical protein RLZZ373_855 [Pseudomonadota bacterium]
MDSGESMEMPKWRCIKDVHALKISAVVLDADEARAENRETDGSAFLLPNDTAYAPIKVTSAYVQKHRPAGEGYYVVYKDGYTSWSPVAAFEEGYIRYGSREGMPLPMSGGMGSAGFTTR